MLSSVISQDALIGGRGRCVEAKSSKYSKEDDEVCDIDDGTGVNIAS